MIPNWPKGPVAYVTATNVWEFWIILIRYFQIRNFRNSKLLFCISIYANASMQCVKYHAIYYLAYSCPAKSEGTF